MCRQDKLPRRPAIPITMYALVAVIASQRITLRAGRAWFGGIEGVVLGALSCVLVVCALVGLVRAWSFSATLLAIGAALAMGWSLSSLTLCNQGEFVAQAKRTALSAWDVRVSSEPTKRDDTYRCRATMSRAGSVAGDVWLTLPQAEEVGTTLRCVGRYSANEEDEWGVASRIQGVWGSVRVSRVTASDTPKGPYGLLVRMRSSVLQSLRPNASPQRALIAGCVCGSREGLKEYGLDDAFSRSGVSHLIAVSGSHLALFSSLAGVALERLGMRYRLRALMLLGICGVYVVFCGLPPSAIRAWVMAGVSMTAAMVGRRSHALSAVSLAGLCMALVEPTVSGQVGYLLSVCAVCGLCLFSPYASYAMGTLLNVPRAPRWVPRSVAIKARGLADAMRESMASSVVAQVCTAPIAIATFGEISLVGPVVNLVVCMPFCAMVCLGLLGAAATPLPAVQAAILVPCDLCAGIVVGVAKAFAGLPHGVVGVTGSGTAAIAAICLLLAVVLVLWPRINRRRMAVVAALAMFIVVGDVVRWRYFAPARICVLDVGQGDSILIQDGSASILVDAGPDDSVVAALQRNHVSHVDAVVITHMHADHYAGVDQLVGHVRCDRVFVGKGSKQNMPDSLSLACKELTGNDADELGYGDVLHVRRFALRMIWPRAEAPGTQNADSVMLAVNYCEDGRSLSGLLTGDAERDETKEAISQGDVGNIDVLKVGHHGSDVSLTASEAATLDPEVSVASAGKNNSYGHPAPECVSILKKEGSVFLCTKDVGDVQVCPGKDGVEVTCHNDPKW